MEQTKNLFPKKYRDLIDEQTWQFIKESLDASPPELAGEPIAVQRESYGQLCNAFAGDWPDSVSKKDIVIEDDNKTTPARLYTCESHSSDTLILYFHGGGFVVGNLDSHDSICADICARTGNRLLAVDYRLSPEHLHPAAFNDAMGAFVWVNRKFDCPIILCGDSAGANLAAAVAHAARHAPKVQRRPLGQVLIYPALGGDTNVGSYQEHANAPLLSLSDVHFYEQIRLESIPTEPDPTLAPLHDADFNGLPHTITLVAECDPLCDDGANYCNAIVNAGGIATNTIETGLVHGHLRARTSVDRARLAFSNICDALSQLANPQDTV